MPIADRFTPDFADGISSAPPPRTPVEMTADGAITIAAGTVYLAKAGVLAATLDTPPLSMDGAELEIVAATANAHTVTQTSPGFNGGGTASDVATFGGAIGDALRLRARSGVWLAVNTNNVTIG